MATARRGAASRLRSGFRSAVGPLLVAVLSFALGHRHLPLLLAAVAVAVVALWCIVPSAMAAVEGFVLRQAGRLAAFVVLAFAEIALVVPVSTALWIVRWDPLRRSPRRAAAPGWRGGRRERDPVAHPFAVEGPSSGGGRWRVALAAFLLVVPVAVVGLVSQHSTSTQPSEASGLVFSRFAFRDAPWIGELAKYSGGMDYDPVLTWRSADTDEPNIHVHDGVRLSYEPPDPAYTVWFIGGSTMYGMGQRDLYTIPSDVARLAMADGVRLAVVNLGVPAYSNWQETQQLSLLLADDRPPDLVVFYDGGNDVPDIHERALQRIADLDRPGNHFQDDPRFQIGEFAPPPTIAGIASPAEQIAALTHVYAAGVDLARRLGASYGTRPVFYWQPAAWSLDGPYDPRVWSATGADHSYEQQLRAIDDGVRQHLPAGVVDLSGALDGATQPTYFDPVHTNELGAELVAEAMWRDLRPRVAALPPRSDATDQLITRRTHP